MSESKPFVVGLTGQTGAGKTTVSQAFEEHGYALINADSVAHAVTEDKELVKKMGELFGQEILLPDGSLDRRMLGAKVFADSGELLKLNTILYPIITKRIQAEIDVLFAAGKTRILLDAPTLFESGANKLCSKTVSVLADQSLRKARIMQRDSIDGDTAQTRMDAQHEDAYYRNRSDYTLQNNGSRDQLFSQGKLLAAQLEKTGVGKSIVRITAAFMLCLGMIFGAYWLFLGWMYPMKYAAFVTESAAQFGVEPALVYAVIKTESGFKPDAVSDAGARGLMQITEATFDWAKTSLKDGAEYADLFEPQVAIRYGSYLLSRYLAEFGEEQAAVAAYHAGRGQVNEWLSDTSYSADGKTLDTIPGAATNHYVGKVFSAKDMYEKLYH